MSRLNNPTPQYLDSAGAPLNKGLLYFYETQTTTLADTYADSGQTVLNSNPVELYADGRQPNIFFTGTLKAILTASDLVQVWERDPVTSGTGESLVTDWDALITYEASDIVRYGTLYYISLLNNNINKIPGAEPLYWATYPNGDITCDTVTSTTFTGALVGDVTGNVTGDVTGDLTGNADTSTTATNALSLGGNLASEYFPDYQSVYATAVTAASGAYVLLGSVNLGSVVEGSVISVSANTNWPVLTGTIFSQIQATGTATFEMNGETAGLSIIRQAVTTLDVFQNGSALINVLTSGTMTVSLYGNQASGAPVDVTKAKLATAYLIKKA